MSNKWLRLLFILTWLLVPILLLCRKLFGLNAPGGMSDDTVNFLAFTLIAFTILRAMMWYLKYKPASGRSKSNQASPLERRTSETPREYLPEFDFEKQQTDGEPDKKS